MQFHYKCAVLGDSSERITKIQFLRRGLTESILVRNSAIFNGYRTMIGEQESHPSLTFEKMD